MSAGFGSENVAFVPAGSLLRVFDLTKWKVLHLDTTRMQICLRKKYHEDLKKELDEIRKLVVKDAENRDAADEDKSTIARFWTEVAEMKEFPSSLVLPPIPFGDSNLIWVRLSSDPAESFFIEDYTEAAKEPATETFTHNTYGSCNLKLSTDQEVPFPNEVDPAFLLQIPRVGGIWVEDFDPHEPVPLIHEFCGANGASSSGWSINITPGAEIAQTHQVCAPLRELNESVFQTLYFQFETREEHQFMRRLSPKGLKNAPGRFQEHGFNVFSEGKNYAIYSRDGGDIVHLYWDLQGHEVQGIDVMPAFMLVVQSEHSFDAEAREQLLKQLLRPISV